MLGTLLDDKIPRNLRELVSRLIEEWKNISVIEVQKVIASMFDHIEAVIANKGGHTKYIM